MSLKVAFCICVVVYFKRILIDLLKNIFVIRKNISQIHRDAQCVEAL